MAAALAATTWVGVVANFGASLLLSGVSTALMGKQAGTDNALRSRQVSSKEPVAARELVYGRVRKAGTIVFMGTSGGFENRFGSMVLSTDDKRLHLVIALAGHQVEGIDEIYFDGELAFNADGSPADRVLTKKGGTVAWAWKHLGGSDQPAMQSLMDHFPGKWTADHRLRGVAYIHIMLYGSNEVFPNGVPNVTVTVRGKNDILDPRTGQRSYTNNAALCIADYVADSRYGLGATVGVETGIRQGRLIEAANVCDEWVSRPDGGSEQRYRCDGIVDTSQTPQTIIQAMLTAMCGQAIYSGGAWNIHAGAYRIPSLALNDDDAAGNVTLTTRMSRSDNFNGVRGVFISPENDWQADDFPAFQSAVYLAEDRGREAWKDLTLPFTTSAYAAQRIAKIQLELARRQMSISWPGRLRCLQAACGDTVSLTRARWGAANKPFVVTGMSLQPVADGLGLMPMLSLSETSPLVYDHNASEMQIYAAAPRTNLPNAWQVSPSGIQSVSEELYVTRTGDGVKSRALIVWSESESVNVDRYVLQGSSDGENWVTIADTRDTQAYFEDAMPGFWQFRVQAITRLGATSEWSYYQAEIYGMAGEPSELQNVTLQTAGGLAVIKWALPSDLDVRYGGRIVIRHSAVPNAGWSNSVSLDEVPGNSTIAVVPLMPGTYFVRAVDSSGTLGPITKLTASGAQVVAFVNAGILQADASFAGTHDKTVAVNGELTLSSPTLWDALPGNVDSLPNWDFPEGPVSEGMYTFGSTMNLGAAKLVRLRALIEMSSLVLSDDWDGRIETVDSFQDWDGDAQGEADVEMQVRTTTDNPAGSPIWGNWSRLDAGEYRARGVQARAILTSKSADVAPVVSVLRVIADEVAA
ncbi:phage tail protein [Paenirhodobacter populi]|uniref:phage tail protein n=1 Tax=Paenirhodobacter populi TaxID=2306993 RepID=UPI001F4F25F6|nr:phage tail protein [Sinirhodobacter populi]